MKINSLSLYKRILLTQLLCILFAIIFEIHIRLLIDNEWMFSNSIIFCIEIIILIVVFTTLIRLFLDGRWINAVMISIPYILYWFVVLVVSASLFPTNTDPDDYGVGLMGVFVSASHWISVIIATIIGTYLNRKNSYK